MTKIYAYANISKFLINYFRLCEYYFLMSINQRFADIINKLYSGNKRAFSKAIGVSPTVIENVVGTRQGNPSFEVVQKVICANANINPDWLINDIGEMYRHANIEKSNIDKSIVAIQDADNNEGEYKRIPLATPFAVAGFGNGDFAINNGDIKDYYVVPLFKDRKIDFMIEVSGASMYPKYNNGDVIACSILRKSRFIQWNKVHLIGTVEQGILVKRIRKGADDQHLLLVSDNKEFEPFVINIEEVTGMALVIGVIRLE